VHILNKELAVALMFHYTDRAGYNGVRATVDWCFKADQPPSDHPFGAYFTTLPQDAHNLAKRLRIPADKTEFFFSFDDVGDLKRLPGGRGLHVLYSPGDYFVIKNRQRESGETDP
jgi:hypothetical protein